MIWKLLLLITNLFYSLWIIKGNLKPFCSVIKLNKDQFLHLNFHANPLNWFYYQRRFNWPKHSVIFFIQLKSSILLQPVMAWNWIQKTTTEGFIFTYQRSWEVNDLSSFFYQTEFILGTDLFQLFYCIFFNNS